MNIDAPTALLGGLSPAAFMRRHWQKKPLLVRQALPGVQPPLARAALFDLAGSDDVESRLVIRDGDGWTVRHGPLPRSALPAARRPGWTLLVQGLDLHVEAAHRLLDAFRFVPAARLDDLMMSWASDGGGVGPHLDAYDVFLIQVHGRRRWRVGRAADKRWVDGLPLKILRHFEPEFECLLEPGDMLYLPPKWAHDGVAEGECMTCSVGFRAPSAGELARQLLQRLGDESDEDGEVDGGAGPLAARYRDVRQAATASPGELPPALATFARQAVQRLLDRPGELERALGEVLTEPKPDVWFPAGDVDGASDSASDSDAVNGGGVVLDARTRMVYDGRHVFINGESFRAGGRDARLMRALADRRSLRASECDALSAEAATLVREWLAHGWLRSAPT
jgi:50S ribosomal protein L16 3-hydroxylase